MIITKFLLFMATILLSINGFSYDRAKQLRVERKNLLESEKNTISVYDNIADSVVFVQNIQLARTWFYGTVEIPRGAGSGFVWDKQGHIITNYHVVKDGSSFLVSFKSQDKSKKNYKQYRAKVVGTVPHQDVAILKLIEKPSRLHPIKPGVSKNLIVGQKAIAIGNPFGLQHTLTTGVISALDRQIEGISGNKIYNMIQTDAAINQGNSGGPLIDSQGKIIGMNTVIFSPSGASAGVGFAVPIDTIKRTMKRFKKFGRVTHPRIGVKLLPDHIKERFGIEKGTVITHVDRNGPADKAGLKGITQDRRGRYKIGDIILSVNNERINSYEDIYHILDKYQIGDKIKLKYLRNGKKRSANIVLDKVY